ncbi:hypothetical protein E7Z54_11460 [Nocardioides sp.]|nr:hypothetical protein E7Z54_11460 [Nocardioides sp.]
MDRNDIHAAVRQGDWDCAVVWDCDVQLEPHLFVLQFGGMSTENFHRHGVQFSVTEQGKTVAAEYAVPDGLSADVARLVRNELAPVVIDRSGSPIFGIQVWGYTAPAPNTDFLEGFIDPFLIDGDGNVVAGRYERNASEGSQWWRVPVFTPNPERWVAAALASWRASDSDRFPGEADWYHRNEWMTAAEEQLRRRQQELLEERERVLSAVDARLAALEEERAEATERAQGGERRLLTAQGDPLVEEVENTLKEFGFDVVNVDTDIATPGDRREDLRVLDPDHVGWIALVEVRGYARGAQLNDLLRLGRFVTRFVREENREPDRVWYVVNQFRDTDPSTRPIPLEANPVEVETFGEDGGVVIDTKDLFTLRMSLRRGELTKQAARARLRDAVERLDLKVAT